jgi:uncharacterized protein
MKENIERRFVTVSMSIDEPHTDAAPVMRGHAAVFDQPSELLAGCFREIIKPGAFSEAIISSDPRALFNHDPSMVLGRKSSGTLRMVEDVSGLAVEIDPPNTSYSRDLQECMKRGDVNQMSFGFTVADGGDEWIRDSGDAGTWTRTITKIERLYDVSPVTFPAYPETDCAIRSLEVVRGKESPLGEDNFERRLRVELEAAY